MPVSKIIQTIRQKNARDIFKSNIFFRGLEYLEQGLVDNVEVSENEVSCTVFGSKNYSVSISLDKNKMHFSCDCPYEFLCKHEAALYLYVTHRYFPEESDEILTSAVEVFTKIMSITEQIKNKIGNYGNINYGNYSVISYLVKINNNLIIDNAGLLDERVFLAYFLFIDYVCQIDCTIQNNTLVTMYDEIDQTTLRIISEYNTLSAFEHFLLTCKLPKIIDKFINLFNSQLLTKEIVESKDFVNTYLALFKYTIRKEVRFFNKEEIEENLTLTIIEILKKQATKDQYLSFLEQYDKTNTMIFFEKINYLFQNEEYEKVINISNNEHYYYIDIIKVGSYEKLGKMKEADELFKMCYHEGLNNKQYDWILQFITRTFLVKHYQMILAICLEKEQYDIYMNICQKEQYLKEAFALCKEKGVIFMNNYVNIFTNFNNKEVLLFYQKEIYEGLKTMGYDYKISQKYLACFKNLIKMKNGKYYAYGIYKAIIGLDIEINTFYGIESVINVLSFRGDVDV